MDRLLLVAVALVALPLVASAQEPEPAAAPSLVAAQIDQPWFNPARLANATCAPVPSCPEALRHHVFLVALDAPTNVVPVYVSIVAPAGYPLTDAPLTDAPGSWVALRGAPNETIFVNAMLEPADVQLPVDVRSLAGLAHGSRGDWRVTVVSLDRRGATPATFADAHLLTTAVDRVAPDLSVTRTAANAAGWNSANVLVDWTCADALSGVSSAPADETRTVETAGEVRTGTCTDRAGNARTLSTSTIRIDRTAPALSVAVTPAANAAGWNKGDVTVDWTCADALSGVAAATADEVRTAETGGETRTGSCTDAAGNAASPLATRTIRIDRTSPSFSLVVAPAANAAGWNAGPVSVDWTCADALSGVPSPPADETLSAETAGATRTGACVDAAGNGGSLTTRTIRIDTTAPALSVAATPAANAAGWNSGDVAVDWTCTDALSGVAEAPADEVRALETDGEALSRSCTDAAGNAVGPVSTRTIRIDRTPPVLTFTRTAPNAAGWNAGDVSVDWSCADARSGVADAPVDETISAETSGIEVTRSCVDVAGNVHAVATDTVRIDRTAPSLSVSVAPEANALGWNAGDVAVDWACADPLSGVATGPGDETLAAETSGETRTATCADAAGNVAGPVSTRTIRIDRTAPVFTVDVMPPANAAGWNAGPVAVDWTCADALSGVPSAPADETLAAETDSTTRSATCLDAAGNGGALTTRVIRIDVTPPLLAFTRTAPNAAGWNAGDVAIDWTCADALSGTDGVVDAVVRAETSASGLAVAETCVDRAGNRHEASTDPIRIDRTPPVLTYARTAANGAGWNADAVAVDWTCVDALSGVAVEPADEVLAAETAGVTLAGSCADRAGHAVETTTDTIRLDLTPPRARLAATCDRAGLDGWCRGAVAVAAAGEDDLSGVAAVHCAVDGAPAACDALAFSADGVRAVSLHVVDRVGREASASLTVKVDATPPTVAAPVACATPGLAGWCRGGLAVDAPASDATSGLGSVSCALDGQPAACALAPSSAGASDFAATATDVAGNSATVRARLLLDDVAPAIDPRLACARSGLDGWCAAALALAVSAADAHAGLATLACALDGAPAACDASVREGQPLLTVVATDAAGNEATFGPLALRRDATPPAAAIDVACDAPGLDGWCLSAARITFPRSDAHAGVASATCALDARAVACDATDVADGAHVARLDVADRAGHAAAVERAVLVDPVPPAPACVASGAEGLAGVYGGEVGVSASGVAGASGLAGLLYSLDGGAFLPYADPVRVAGDGIHTFVARAVNGAGAAADATCSFTIDTSRPSTTLAFAVVREGSGAPRLRLDVQLAPGARAGSRAVALLDGVEVASPFEVALDGPHQVAHHGVGPGGLVSVARKLDVGGNAGRGAISLSSPLWAGPATATLGLSASDRVLALAQLPDGGARVDLPAATSATFQVEGAGWLVALAERPDGELHARAVRYEPAAAPTLDVPAPAPLGTLELALAPAVAGGGAGLAIDGVLRDAAGGTVATLRFENGRLVARTPGPGAYVAEVVVRNGPRVLAQASVPVVVASDAPVIALAVTPAGAEDGEDGGPILLAATASDRRGALPVAWSCAAPCPADLTVENGTVLLEKAGVYRLTATATGVGGVQARLERSFNVTGPLALTPEDKEKAKGTPGPAVGLVLIAALVAVAATRRGRR